MSKANPALLVCRCEHRHLVPETVQAAVLAASTETGQEAISVPDLCGMATRSQEKLAELVAGRTLSIVACYPRAVRWLLHRAGLDPDATVSRYVNAREQSDAEILRQLFGHNADTPAPVTAGATPSRIDTEDPWVPWFPVIDYDRCKNCGQCLNFCLFGVYSRSDDKRVTVSQPWNCKDNCPACARICPQAAIMFPKIDEAPINGAEIEDEELVKANIKLNVKELLGNDVYSALAARRKKAKMRLLKKRNREQAEQEREHCAEGTTNKH